MRVRRLTAYKCCGTGRRGGCRRCCRRRPSRRRRRRCRWLLASDAYARCRRAEVHPEQREEQATDGTPCGTLRYPEIRIKAVRGQAVPAADAFAGVRHAKLIRWRVNGALAPHVLLWFTPKRLVQAADADGLAAVLHAAETGCPGAPLILLTHSVNSECKRAAAAAAAAGGDASAAAAAAAAAAGLHSNEAEHMQQRLRELAAELAVWRPDVIFHNASSSKDAAEHVWRLSRAVGKLQAGCKRTVRFISQPAAVLSPVVCCLCPLRCPPRAASLPSSAAAHATIPQGLGCLPAAQHTLRPTFTPSVAAG